MTAGSQVPPGVDALARMDKLPKRGKSPASARVLNDWITRAQQTLGMEAGRLGWLIASTVVVAALQRAVDETGRSLFLLKGGTYLQHRLSYAGRPTKDVDGLVRGDLDSFLAVLDGALRLPWGPLTLARSEAEVIATPTRVDKPRRFDVRVSLKGQVWRRIQVEVAPDEAGAGAEEDVIRAPGLGHFGLPNPDFLLGIALRYQIAQKIHACTDPHDPPNERNDRARDVVDLLLLRDLASCDGTPSPAELREACLSLFDARAADARTLGRTQRRWPPLATAHPHWAKDYEMAARGGGVDLPLDQAIDQVNAWITLIDSDRADM
jgi:hypothetical protein